MMNSPATFQSMMNDYFADMIAQGWVLICLDNILIFSRNPREHNERTTKVPVLYLAPHTPGGIQVVLVDLVDSRWSPPGFHKNSHISTEFSGVHLESTWSPLDSIWTPSGLQLDSMNFTKFWTSVIK